MSHFIPIVYRFLLLLVLGIGIYFYKKQSLPYKILTWWVLMEFLLEILSKIWITQYKNNIPVMHLSCIAEFVFYSIAYYYLFKNKKIKKTIIITLIIITVFFIINALVFQPYHKVFPSNVSVLTQASYILFSFLLFREMLLYPIEIDILKQKVFWYNGAIMFYATTLFFLLAIGNYLPANPIIFYFWYFVLYTFNILIAISLFINNKKFTYNR